MVRITKPKKNLNDLEFINKFCCKKTVKRYLHLHLGHHPAWLRAVDEAQSSDGSPTRPESHPGRSKP